MILKDASTDLADKTAFGEPTKSFLPYSISLTFASSGPQTATDKEIAAWLKEHFAQQVLIDLVDVS